MAGKIELSERKHTILKAIIQNYLETGERSVQEPFQNQQI